MKTLIFIDNQPIPNLIEKTNQTIPTKSPLSVIISSVFEYCRPLFDLNLCNNKTSSLSVILSSPPVRRILHPHSLCELSALLLEQTPPTKSDYQQQPNTLFQQIFHQIFVDNTSSTDGSTNKLHQLHTHSFQTNTQTTQNVRVLFINSREMRQHTTHTPTDIIGALRREIIGHNQLVSAGSLCSQQIGHCDFHHIDVVPNTDKISQTFQQTARYLSSSCYRMTIDHIEQSLFELCAIHHHLCCVTIHNLPNQISSSSSSTLSSSSSSSTTSTCSTTFSSKKANIVFATGGPLTTVPGQNANIIGKYWDNNTLHLHWKKTTTIEQLIDDPDMQREYVTRTLSHITMLDQHCTQTRQLFQFIFATPNIVSLGGDTEGSPTHLLHYHIHSGEIFLHHLLAPPQLDTQRFIVKQEHNISEKISSSRLQDLVYFLQASVVLPKGLLDDEQSSMVNGDQHSSDSQQHWLTLSECLEENTNGGVSLPFIEKLTRHFPLHSTILWDIDAQSEDLCRLISPLKNTLLKDGILSADELETATELANRLSQFAIANDSRLFPDKEKRQVIHAYTLLLKELADFAATCKHISPSHEKIHALLVKQSSGGKTNQASNLSKMKASSSSSFSFNQYRQHKKESRRRKRTTEGDLTHGNPPDKRVLDHRPQEYREAYERLKKRQKKQNDPCQKSLFEQIFLG